MPSKKRRKGAVGTVSISTVSDAPPCTLNGCFRELSQLIDARADCLAGCATAITTGAAPFSNCYKPEMAFTSLFGTSAQGAWTIKVADDESGDVGTLEDWTLIFCIAP